MAEPPNTVIPLIGQTISTFGGDVLPTVMDVLKLYFFYHTTEGWSQKDSVKKVAHEICELWTSVKLPIFAERNVVRKVLTYVLRYRDILRNSKRGGATQERKEADYVKSINALFDISSKNAFKLMSDNDEKLFLMDQQTDRKFVISNLQKAHEQTEQQNRKKLRKYRKTLEK